MFYMIVLNLFEYLSIFDTVFNVDFVALIIILISISRKRRKSFTDVKYNINLMLQHYQKKTGFQE